MSKVLLLISGKPEDQAFAAEVAITAGLSLRAVSDPAEGAEIIANEDPKAILVDASSEQHYQAFEAAIQQTIGLFSDKANANSIHFITAINLDQVPWLVHSPLFGHYVQRNFIDVKEAGANYGRIVKGVLNERGFGLSNFLKEGTKVQVIKLRATSQKQDAVEAIKNYLLAAKFQSRMATTVANAVDELLMNAMFDAPVDDLGKPVYSLTSRSTNMQLEGKNSVEMHVSYDGTYVAITAVDMFGSLDKAKMLSHISKIYKETEYKVKATVAGAGIGLATVFKSGGSFLFVSESRARTEVTVFFKRTDNFRQFKDQFRFLSTQFYF